MDSEKLNDQWSAVKAQILGYPDVNAAEISAFFSRLEPQAMSDSFLMLTARPVRYDRYTLRRGHRR